MIAVQKSGKQVSPLWAVVALLGLSQMVTGCSGLDDLRVINHYPFAVRLWERWDKEQKLLGVVPPHTEQDFAKAGGFEGNGLNYITCADARDKKIGTLRQIGHNVRREEVSRFNGTAVWSVTVGPLQAAAVAPSPFFAALSEYRLPIVILLGASLFLLYGAYEERRKRKTVERPR